jgi:trimeric autotransporter adhesin
MSAQVTITQLPAAGAITGTEAVPIVQNGQTVQTTTGAIAASPSQTQTFITKNQEPTLPNSRALSGGTGIGLTDGGAQSTLQVFLNGVSASLESSSNGIIAKVGGSVTGRTLQTSGVGLTVADGNGLSGNPTFSLTGVAASVANLSGTGMLALTGGGTSVSGRTMLGTANQINLANGDGASGSPTFSLANNATLPGVEGVTIPAGTTAERPLTPNNGEIRYNTTTSRVEAYLNGTWTTMGVGDGTVTSVSGTANQISVASGSTTPVISITTNPTLPGTAYVQMPAGDTAARPLSPTNGMMRYNTDSLAFEGYINGAWSSFASTGVGVISVNTGTGLTGGPITTTGTISIANTAVTAGSYNAANITVNAQGQITAASSNSALVSTFSAGTTGLTPATATSGAVTLGGTLIPANGGTGVGSLTGYVYGNGTTAMTASTTIPTTDLSGTVSNAQLANSSVTVGTTNIALGASSLTLGGLTSVAVTQDPVSNLQVATKQYVDGLTSTGLVYHQPVQAGTTASLASTTGGTVTYNNGTAGVGATITLSIPLLILDGYTLLNTNRILIKNEVNQAYNGVYTWATGGTVLTRATDADTYGNSVNQLSQNDYFFTQNGTVNKGTSYVVTTVGTITFGTTAITFAEFSSSLVYTGTSPIDVSGTVISLTTVPATLGGTGQTSYGTGDLLYASNSTTLSKRAIGTEGYALRVTSGVPDWQLLATAFPITLHSGVTVIDVPITNGYFPVLLHNGVTTVNVTCF